MPIHRIESGVAPAKSRLIIQELNDTADVLTINSITRTFTPPVGKLWKIKGMYLRASAPPGAASGTHRFMLSTGAVFAIMGASVFGSSVEWHYSHWKIADSQKLPAESETTLIALLNILFSHDNPVKITYTNGTDVTASGSRSITLYIEETPIT